MKPLSRRAAHHRATLAAELPEYASDLKPVRGRCRKGRCRSRWAVPRVSIDFRDPTRVDRIATLECAGCGHVWRRVAVPPLTSAAGYQTVRLSLVLPATVNRWFSRGRWHREGEDALVLREASIGDLDEAARSHASRAAVIADRKARDRARREATETESHERTMQLLARLEAMDAANRLADSEADSRAA